MLTTNVTKVDEKLTKNTVFFKKMAKNLLIDKNNML